MRQPVFNNMPAGVLILAGPIILAALLPWISPALNEWLFEASVLVMTGPGEPAPPQPLGPLAPYLLHILIHFGLLHLVLNLTIILSAGRLVAARFGTDGRGTLGFVLFFLACSACGALAETVFHQGGMMVMGGASTGASGLIAAIGWISAGWRGLIRFALPWIGFNLLIGLTGFAMPIQIGWIAHIGGTLAGAALLPAFLVLFGGRR
mgnify:CR=1 FL=1